LLGLKPRRQEPIEESIEGIEETLRGLKIQSTLGLSQYAIRQ